MDFYDGSPTNAYRGVSGGFRAGKRRRGNSLLKRKPKEAVTVTRYDVFDGNQIVALDVDMVTYRREPNRLPDEMVEG